MPAVRRKDELWFIPGDPNPYDCESDAKKAFAAFASDPESYISNADTAYPPPNHELFKLGVFVVVGREGLEPMDEIGGLVRLTWKCELIDDEGAEYGPYWITQPDAYDGELCRLPGRGGQWIHRAEFEAVADAYRQCGVELTTEYV